MLLFLSVEYILLGISLIYGLDEGVRNNLLYICLFKEFILYLFGDLISYFSSLVCSMNLLWVVLRVIVCLKFVIFFFNVWVWFNVMCVVYELYFLWWDMMFWFCLLSLVFFWNLFVIFFYIFVFIVFVIFFNCLSIIFFVNCILICDLVMVCGVVVIVLGLFVFFFCFVVLLDGFCEEKLRNLMYFVNLIMSWLCLLWWYSCVCFCFFFVESCWNDLILVDDR